MKVDLYGSLAMTGKGHGTDKALVGGLLGFRPDELIGQHVPWSRLERTGTQPFGEQKRLLDVRLRQQDQL